MSIKQLGESVPIAKIPATEGITQLLAEVDGLMNPAIAKHALFCGTQIIRARRPQHDVHEEAVALAVVLRTGFQTAKGSLVRSMLFPPPSDSKIYVDAFRYIAVMAAVAGVGFLASFINFVRLGLAWHLIIVRALDLITIVVPPALPATLTIGTNFALSRLKQKGIFCISPPRINIGGKVDLMCFDKTGTLTEDGLDVLGVSYVDQELGTISSLLDSSAGLIRGSSHASSKTRGVMAAMLCSMSSCHSLQSVDNELIGDPLDVKMFEFTGFMLQENANDFGQGFQESIKPSDSLMADIEAFDETRSLHTMRIIKTYEFIPQLRRASVLVNHPQSRSYSAFTKGAPESVRLICSADSLPTDLEQVVDHYTSGGYRVIACASKKVPISSIETYTSRQDIEKDLRFLGLIIFENKLKPRTIETIERLEDAKIRTIMCTGDNILTAISVGRHTSIIDSNSACFLPHLDLSELAHVQELRWHHSEDTELQLDPHTLEV